MVVRCMVGVPLWVAGVANRAGVKAIARGSIAGTGDPTNRAERLLTRIFSLIVRNGS